MCYINVWFEKITKKVIYDFFSVFGFLYGELINILKKWDQELYNGKKNK